MKTYKISNFLLVFVKSIAIISLPLIAFDVKANDDELVNKVCSGIKDFAMSTITNRQKYPRHEILSKLDPNDVLYDIAKPVVDKAYKEKIPDKISALQMLDKAMLFSEQQYQDCLPKMQAKLMQYKKAEQLQSSKQIQSNGVRTITISANCMGCSVSDFSINAPSGVRSSNSFDGRAVHLSPLTSTSPIPSGNYSYSLKLGSRYCSGSFYLDNSKSYITLGFFENSCKTSSVTGR